MHCQVSLSLCEHHRTLHKPRGSSLLHAQAGGAARGPGLQTHTARYPSEYCGQCNTVVSVGVTEHTEHRKGTIKTQDKR